MSNVQTISSQAVQEWAEGSETSAYSPDRTMEHHERAAVKYCSKCKVGQVFTKTCPWCKSCKAEHARTKYYSDPVYRAAANEQSYRYWQENKEKLLKQKSEYGKRVAERDKARKRERYAADEVLRARHKKRVAKYYQENPHVFRARDAKRRAELLQATPAWADFDKIKAVYALAQELTALTGVQHEVDHVIPLKGRGVRGLHVHTNLQVIPKHENRRKFNKFTDDIVRTAWDNPQMLGIKSPSGNTMDDASFASLTPPARYSSYLQISSKTFLVSDTLEAVNRAGRKSELARGAMVKMRELKRDMETRMTQNGISTLGGAGTGRSTAGMESWIGDATAESSTASHVMLATTTASATTAPLSSGTAGVAPTDGTTLGPMTAASLNFALEAAWADGGDPRVILTNTTGKKAIDAFTGVATRFVDVDGAKQASIIGAANVYVSDFGKHQVILHRYMRSSVVLCLDPDYWAIRYLRGFQKRKLAKTGDGEKYQIITEWALSARNWKANSKVVAVNG